jgi:glycosyltransferase involved in cell wall biosynthesis
MTDEPIVSVIVPCRNERDFIAQCLDSILASDFPLNRLEVLVIDGMSDDGTREVLAEYQRLHHTVRVIDNPRGITPAAFNLGVEHSRGDLVMIMSAHATYAPEAIRKCVAYSASYDADNVGGICVTVPRTKNLAGKAIVLALSHRFGVGGAQFRTGGFSTPRWADTAAFGCYRRNVFDRIGTFNEQLLCSQDIEFNLRLMAAGGRTLLAPDVVVNYFARADMYSFRKHNFRNGRWVVLPFLYCDVMPVRLRHLIPMFFVCSLLASAALGLFFPIFRELLLAIAATYLLASIAVAFQIAARARDWRLIFLMPLIFLFLHLPYGFGSLSALGTAAASPERAKLFRLPLRRCAKARHATEPRRMQDPASGTHAAVSFSNPTIEQGNASHRQ